MPLCSHPVGIPILDCCEEAADLPLYIYVYVVQQGFWWIANIGGTYYEEYFSRKSTTWDFNAAAEAAGAIDSSMEEFIDRRTGAYSSTGGPPSMAGDYQQRVSETHTGLPNPVDTYVTRDISFPSRIMTTTVQWLDANPCEAMVQKCQELLAAADFSGLSGKQHPLGFQFNTNCKVIDWDGNQRITWSGLHGPIPLDFVGGYQRSVWLYSVTTAEPGHIRINGFEVTKLKCLSGEYYEEKWVDALYPSTGTMQYSTRVTISPFAIYEPPEPPSTTYWREMAPLTSGPRLHSRIDLRPTAP